jgi:(+)-trans-carveol dehydrogenase
VSPTGRVEGKVALVTGAARGQGRSHAVRLAEEGADLVICDLCGPIEAVKYPLPEVAELEETAAQIEKLDRRVIYRQLDVRDGDATAALVDQCRTEFGRLDIVAPQAGIASYAMNQEIDDALWQEVIDINLTGVWKTVRPAIPLIEAGGQGGAIVLTSSVAGELGLYGLAHYVAAKHGVVGIMRALANELGAAGIRVNAILPGTVNTPMAANDATYELFRPDLEHPTLDDVDEPMRALTLVNVRWVEPIDISNAVLWLASDEARFITGVALPVDAGYIAKTF